MLLGWCAKLFQSCLLYKNNAGHSSNGSGDQSKFPGRNSRYCCHVTIRLVTLNSSGAFGGICHKYQAIYMTTVQENIGYILKNVIITMKITGNNDLNKWIPCMIYNIFILENIVIHLLSMEFQNLKVRLLSYNTCLDTKPVLYQDRFCIFYWSYKTACSKTGFVPSLTLLHQNRLCAYAKPAAPRPALRWP